MVIQGTAKEKALRPCDRRAHDPATNDEDRTKGHSKPGCIQFGPQNKVPQTLES